MTILYSFRRCPYAMRARMALKSQEVKLELREVVLRDKPPSMMKLSPKGTVPVLRPTRARDRRKPRCYVLGVGVRRRVV